jgi:tetratricopeptide (TPR) repeat protein
MFAARKLALPLPAQYAYKVSGTVLLLITTGLHAQTQLKFDKRFVECEDKWVVFRPDKDGTYHYGFIYIDEQAGLTQQVGGAFTIAQDGTYVRIPQGLDSTSIKVRLQPNQVRVALLPPAAFASLKIKATPEWLHFYKTDTVSVKHLYRWGFLYNVWDESAKALTYLQRAQQLDPNFSGLAPELAYTYNALQQYDKAIPVALNGLKTAPDNCYTYKELSYAQLQLGQLKDAAATYQKSVSLCTDKEIKSEIAFNLTGQYYRAKDRSNFDYWAKETAKWATKGDKFSVNLASMQATFSK